MEGVIVKKNKGGYAMKGRLKVQVGAFVVFPLRRFGSALTTSSLATSSKTSTVRNGPMHTEAATSLFGTRIRLELIRKN